MSLTTKAWKNSPHKQWLSVKPLSGCVTAFGGVDEFGSAGRQNGCNTSPASDISSTPSEYLPLKCIQDPFSDTTEPSKRWARLGKPAVPLGRKCNSACNGGPSLTLRSVTVPTVSEYRPASPKNRINNDGKSITYFSFEIG